MISYRLTKLRPTTWQNCLHVTFLPDYVAGKVTHAAIAGQDGDSKMVKLSLYRPGRP